MDENYRGWLCDRVETRARPNRLEQERPGDEQRPMVRAEMSCRAADATGFETINWTADTGSLAIGSAGERRVDRAAGTVRPATRPDNEARSRPSSPVPLPGVSSDDSEVRLADSGGN